MEHQERARQPPRKKSRIKDSSDDEESEVPHSSSHPLRSSRGKKMDDTGVPTNWSPFCKMKLKYCVAALAFSPFIPNVFATVSSNMARVFILGSTNWTEQQTYTDGNENEDYSTCCWSYDAKGGDPLLVVAGKLSIIRVFNCAQQELRLSLLGHLDRINDLKPHPLQPHLLLSASNDSSLRLWDLRTGRCSAIFRGENYVAPIYSCDIHFNGSKFVSAGGQNRTLVWSIDDNLLNLDNLDKDDNNKHRKPKLIVFPDYVVTNAKAESQSEYVVDCVAWYGDLLLLKSVTKKAVAIVYAAVVDTTNKRKTVLASPLEPQYDVDDPGLDLVAIASLSFPDNSLDPEQVDRSPIRKFRLQGDTVIAGLRPGELVHWSLTSEEFSSLTVNSATKSGSVWILDSAFSDDGRTMIISTSDGYLIGYRIG